MKRWASFVVVMFVVACAGPRQPRVGVPDPAPTSGPTKTGDRIDDALERIRELESRPLPPGNYKVSLERVWVDEREARSLSAMFGYTDERVSVRVGDVPSTSTFRVGVARDGFHAALAAELSRVRGAVRESTFLVTVADVSSLLAVGETRMAAPFYVGDVEYAVLVPGGQFLGTSIEVTVAEVRPGEVAVAVTPVFTNLSGRGDLTSLTELRTRVIAPLDVPVLLASHDERRDSAISTLLSRRNESRSERGALVLTVTGG